MVDRVLNVRCSTTIEKEFLTWTRRTLSEREEEHLFVSNRANTALFENANTALFCFLLISTIRFSFLD